MTLSRLFEVAAQAVDTASPTNAALATTHAGEADAVGFAADLQLAAAIPSAELVEYIGGSPYLDDIKLGGWTLDAEGQVEIPQLPGLGIELDIEQLARFTPDARHLLVA